MPLNGAKVVVGVNVGTDASPVFSILGHQRGVTFDESVEAIDMSSKESEARKVEGGRYQSSVSLESLYVPSSNEYGVLRTRFRNREKVLVRRQLEGQDWEEASVLITSLSEDFPDQAEATVSLTLEVDGKWTVL